MRRALWLTLILASASCSSDPPDGTITLTTGEETDTFGKAPAPVLLVVEKVAVDGTATEIARVNLPTDSIDLGTPGKEDIAAFRVSGYDATNAKVVRGESQFFQLGALEATSINLFVQRTGELARVPSSPAVGLEAPAVDVVLGRYVIEANGTSTQLYDLLFNRANAAPPTLPRPAKSLVSYGTDLLVIDENGGTNFDLSTGDKVEQTVPAGGNFGEVAGGVTLRTNDNTAYVVGATRAGSPSARILVVSTTGSVTFASMTTARKGACATYVTGKGLVIAGGDQGTPELLAPGATQTVPLAFPAEALEGCAAAWLDGTRVVVAKTKVEVLDVSCTVNCAAQPWPGDLPYVRAEATGFSGDAALVTGDDANGVTHVFRLSSGAAREVAVKVPRKGSRLIGIPSTSALLLGGAPQIEMYRD